LKRTGGYLCPQRFHPLLCDQSVLNSDYRLSDALVTVATIADFAKGLVNLFDLPHPQNKAPTTIDNLRTKERKMSVHSVTMIS